jgi:hypothetical protein
VIVVNLGVCFSLTEAQDPGPLGFTGSPGTPAAPADPLPALFGPGRNGRVFRIHPRAVSSILNRMKDNFKYFS